MPGPSEAGTPPPPAARKPRAPRASKRDEREAVIAGMGQLAQVPLIALKMNADVGAMSAHWPGIAHEVAVLADTQPAIAGVIDPLAKVGPYAALVTAALPLVMQLAVNHGRAPAGALGTVAPEVLEAQVQAAISETELHALRVQQEAQEQARRIREEINREHAPDGDDD